MGRWPSKWPRSAYLIGIGGSAMSNIAALLVQQGVRVGGSDRAVYPPASDILSRAGIEPQAPYDANHIDPQVDLVVVGNAISRGNPELERALDTGLPIASMSEVIERLIVPGRRVSVVAGTHGKTTTSSMLAYLHDACGTQPSFIVGGELGNFGVGARLADGPDLIIEGDEYDTAFFDKGPKFLHYWPQIAVLGTVEFDHADIYADLDAVERAFSLFVRLVPSSGTLIADADCAVTMRLARNTHSKLETFGLQPAHDAPHWCATQREATPDGQRFTVRRGAERLAGVELAIQGSHNAKNALAALAAAYAAGLDVATAASKMKGFVPPKRRLQRVARTEGIEIYDDFAHHPTSVGLTLAALRERVPAGGRLIACIEPRSNTMARRVVQGTLCEALSAADRVLVGPVDRPERFDDNQRLDVGKLVEDLAAQGVDALGPLTPDQIFDHVVDERRTNDVIVLMSNGSFAGLSLRFAQRFGAKAQRT